jgi:predicted esterase
MATRSYDEVQAEAMEHYQAQDYAGALEILTREGDRFPEEAANVLYLRSCMAARVGHPDLALQILEDALNRGLWYGEQVMRESPSWQPLQGLPAFERLAAVCKERQATAQIGPDLRVLEPADGCPAPAACPLFLALHGNAGTADSAIQGWRAVAAAGWRLVALQSSQVGGVNAYLWNDQETAVRETAAQYAELCDRYAVDPARLVVAGFSLGGETALRIVLSGSIPAPAFILLGPGGPMMETPAAWLPLIAQGAGRGVRGYVFLGERDNAVEQDAARRVVDLLNANGVPCGLEMLPNLGHAYPADFGPGIRRALAFVLPAPEA